MRKFVLAAVGLFFTVGLALAAEVTFVGFNKDKSEVTVKDKDGKEMTLKVDDKTTFKAKDKEGNEKDIPNDKGVKQLERMDMSEKAKGKAKFTIEASDDKKTVKSITFKGGKK